MNKINAWIRNYFGFSKTEANGFVVLLPLSFIIIISPYVYTQWIREAKPIIYNEPEIVDSLLSALKKNFYYDTAANVKQIPFAETYFTKSEKYKPKRKHYDSNYKPRTKFYK